MANKQIYSTQLFGDYDTRKTETGRQRQRAESEQGARRMRDTADERARSKPEEEVKTITVHNPDNLKTAPYTDFIELQGDLKTLPAENLEKLKQSIITYGICFPAFIWLSEGKKYIVDAHQRMKAFAALEAGGYIVPEVPYTVIHAANKKEAAELLLQANSRYGVINESTTFFEKMNLDLSFLEKIEIPELSNLNFEGLEEDPKEKEINEEDLKFEHKCPKCGYEW